MGLPLHFPPVSSQSGRFMNMPVQCEQWLFLLDETLNGNTSDMHIQLDVINLLSIQSGAVKVRLIRR